MWLVHLSSKEQGLEPTIASDKRATHFYSVRKVLLDKTTSDIVGALVS